MTLLFLIAGLMLLNPVPQDSDSSRVETYKVFTSSGERATLDDIFASLDDTDVVLIGETHDDSVAHALELDILVGAYRAQGPASDTERPLALSLEMFQTDTQHILDEYLAGLITEKHFLDSSRPWSNYDTDYRPLVEFARAHKLPVIASNAPRRYVNRVTRLGSEALQDLPDYAVAMLPPLPHAEASESYTAKWNRTMAEAMQEMASQRTDSVSNTMAEMTEEEEEDVSPHRRAEPDSIETDSEVKTEEVPAAPQSHAPMESGMSNMLASQSLWDASMAHSIVKHLIAEPEGLVVHAVGAFHVERGTGIPEHLLRYRPSTRTLIVAIRSADDFTKFDAEKHDGLGDFVILTDASLPRSYSSR